MGDHHDGLVEIVVQLPEEIEDHLRVPGIQVGTRFIGKQEGWPVHERPGDRHPLLLASGHLGGEVVDPVAQPHDPEDISADQRALLRGHPPGHRGEVDVLPGGQLGNEGIVLEDVSEPSQSEHRPGLFIEGSHIDPVNQEGSAGGTVKKTEHMKQGRLPAPTRSHHPDKLPFLYFQGHPVESPDLYCPKAVVSFEICSDDHVSP